MHRKKMGMNCVLVLWEVAGVALIGTHLTLLLVFQKSLNHTNDGDGGDRGSDDDDRCIYVFEGHCSQIFRKIYNTQHM